MSANVPALLRSRSLASNQMVSETDYVNKSKVQAESFEVGEKVMYEGYEMTVSQAPDRNGDIKMLDLYAIFALCDALPQMTALTALKCAYCIAPPISTQK